jgi:hypothetical protein
VDAKTPTNIALSVTCRDMMSNGWPITGVEMQHGTAD